MDSPGGDVTAAMQMGGVIWRNNWGTIIPAKSVCMSSCVLVYAAGTQRYIYHDSKLGVHRAVYMDDVVDDVNSFAARYDHIFSKIQIYLDRFGVSKQVVELMKSTPSTRIRLLSEHERNDWGLGSENVAEEEMRRERIRKGCGREYEKRFYAYKNTLNKSCPYSLGVWERIECDNELQKQFDVNDNSSCMSPR